MKRVLLEVAKIGSVKNTTCLEAKCFKHVYIENKNFEET